MNDFSDVFGAALSRPGQAVAPKSSSVRSDKVQSGRSISGESFAQVLRQQTAVSDVVMSGHANERLRMRGIVQTPQLMRELNQAVNQLAQKSAKDALVVIGDVGFVVSVPNRTVVTALAMETDGNQIFTNIDSAVWVKSPHK